MNLFLFDIHNLISIFSQSDHIQISSWFWHSVLYILIHLTVESCIVSVHIQYTIWYRCFFIISTKTSLSLLRESPTPVIESVFLSFFAVRHDIFEAFSVLWLHDILFVFHSFLHRLFHKSRHLLRHFEYLWRDWHSFIRWTHRNSFHSNLHHQNLFYAKSKIEILQKLLSKRHKLLKNLPSRLDSIVWKLKIIWITISDLSMIFRHFSYSRHE